MVRKLGWLHRSVSETSTFGPVLPAGFRRWLLLPNCPLLVARRAIVRRVEHADRKRVGSRLLLLAVS